MGEKERLCGCCQKVEGVPEKTQFEEVERAGSKNWEAESKVVLCGAEACGKTAAL